MGSGGLRVLLESLMSGEIERIPALPDEIVEAVNRDKLAVFIGAGVSRLVGCLGWDDLGRNLIERCFSEGVIIHREKESLAGMKDSRKVLTICHDLLKEKGIENVFFEEMRKALKDGQEVTVPNIYDDIYRLRGLFVTTNVDRHFHRKFNLPNIIYRIEELRADNIDRVNLYHLHGCISQPETVVFTLRSYFKRYRDTESFRAFLKTIFSKYTILFLGYGLAEFELLEYLFEQSDVPDAHEVKHFMLQAFNSGEERILGFEQIYYGQMGIQVKAYRKNEKGYEQLADVVKEWSTRIIQLSNYLHETFEEIDRLIEDRPE
jgi:hypothetical protein